MSETCEQTRSRQAVDADEAPADARRDGVILSGRDTGDQNGSHRHGEKADAVFDAGLSSSTIPHFKWDVGKYSYRV